MSVNSFSPDSRDLYNEKSAGQTNRVAPKFRDTYVTGEDYGFTGVKPGTPLIFSKPSVFGNLITKPLGCGGPAHVAGLSGFQKSACLFLRGPLGQLAVVGVAGLIVYKLVKG